MEANIWGPNAWLFLHSITLNYPDNPTVNTKKIYSDFFNSLSNILPCDICKTNFKKHLSQYPIRFHLNSKENLCKWLVKIHNLTNIDNKKSTISYENFLKNYKKIYSNSWNYKYIVVVIVLIGISYIVYHNYLIPIITT